MALLQSIAKLFSPSGKCSSPSDGESAHLLLGRRGEDLAARHLRRNGFKVLYRNFRARGGGEVDIVCRDKKLNTLVFVEVKTRTSTEFGRPADAVKSDKRELITRGALAWLRLLDNPDILFRFDIAEVLIVESDKPEITLIRDAFQLPKRMTW